MLLISKGGDICFFVEKTILVVIASPLRSLGRFRNLIWTFPCGLTAYLFFVCLFVCFVALCPKSTAMVIEGRSVHLTTLFPGQA